MKETMIKEFKRHLTDFIIPFFLAYFIAQIIVWLIWG